MPLARAPAAVRRTGASCQPAPRSYTILADQEEDMPLIRLALTALALVAAAPPPDSATFEQALESSNLGDAATLVDRLLVERTPADGAPRSDPLLNALIGRLLLAGQNANAAALYLDHLSLADLPPALRQATAMAHGRALELRGDRLAALAAYRAAADAGPATPQGRRAVIGEARQLLADDQASARTLLLGIANGPPTPERWNANYLLSAVDSLAGDPQSAARFADQAWVQALQAPASDLAPIHVAALRGALAAAVHDLPAERAMLLATNGLTTAASTGLSSQLPVCGDRGLRPTDYVIFAYVAGPYLTRDLIPVAASRPAAIAPFHDALQAVAPIKIDANTAPVGTTFKVSCRTIVSPNYAKPLVVDPLLEWFVTKGIYPASASNEAEDAQVNAIADRIDALERRFGKESPLLIGPRWQMILLLEKRAQAGAAVSPGQVAGLSSQVAKGMRQAGAPEWIVRTIELRSAIEQTASNQRNASANVSTLNQLARQQLLLAPFRIARQQLSSVTANLKSEWPAEASQLVLDLNAQLPADIMGRERQAWLLYVLQAQEALGKTKEGKTALSSAGLSPDLCVLAEEDPALLEQRFSYKDYPHDLQIGDQEGTVLLDFDLSPSGTVSGHRVLYSLPSNLFDEASAKGLSSLRYTPAKKSGKAVACNGLVQPIVWRLEGNDDFAIPTFTSEVSGPTS